MTKKCSLKAFCQDDCKICTNENKIEKRQRIVELIEPIVADIMTTLAPVIENAIQNFTHLWKCIMETYPNKRVVYLALHHPKEKVRKKNTNRIMRWINKAR